MTTELYDYQKAGVARLHELKGRALLCDSMGLGKTIQIIQYAIEADAYPMIVVCPRALKLQWQSELKVHFGLDSEVLHGTTPRITKSLLEAKIFIINWDILEMWLSFLRRRRPTLVVGDEVQNISNLSAQRTQYFHCLCDGVKKIILASGTPLTNCPWELFSSLSLLLPKVFDSSWSYGMEYCDGKKSYGKWQFKGAKNLNSLHIRLKQLCMVRRLKSEVAKDLPPKRRYVVPLDIDNRKEYDKAESNFIGWLMEKDTAAAQRAAKAERFTKFTYLRHLAAQLKINMVIAWLRGFLQESEGKIVMGTWHKDVLARLLKEEWGTGVQAIDGDSTERNAKRSEEIFKTDPGTRILFGQIKTIGVGLNLPEASAVALAEIPFTPAACLQLEDRGSRITSVNPLDVYYLAASGTIEELLCQIIQRKARVSDAVLDGKQAFDDSLNIYDELQLALIQKGAI